MNYFSPLEIACLAGAAYAGFYWTRVGCQCTEGLFATVIHWVQDWRWRRANPEDAKLREEYEEHQRKTQRERAQQAISPVKADHGGYH